MTAEEEIATIESQLRLLGHEPLCWCTCCRQIYVKHGEPEDTHLALLRHQLETVLISRGPLDHQTTEHATAK